MRNLLFPAASALALLCGAGPLVAQTGAPSAPMPAPMPAPMSEPMAAPPAPMPEPAPGPMPEPVSANPAGSAEMPSETPPNPETAATPVPPAMPADAGYRAAPYKGAMTAAPAEAMNKVYPVCTRKIQDSCRNRGGK